MKVTEIDLLGEGFQIKKYIMQHYSTNDLNDAVELLTADLSNYEPSSIHRYLRSKTIKNQKFKRELSALLNKNYEDIVVDIKKQLTAYVNNIKDNMLFYNDENDIMLLTQLYNLTIKFKLEYNQITIAKGNIALHKLSMQQLVEARRLLNETILEAEENNYIDLAVYYRIQLAYAYLNENPKISHNTIKSMNIEENKSKLSNNTLHRYYYFFGILLQVMDKSMDAIKKLDEACKYADNSTAKLKCIINKAICYKNIKKFKASLKWNKEAIKLAKDDKDILSGIYNNISNLYIHKNDLKSAKFYINEALKMKPDDVNRKICIIDTYISLYDDDSIYDKIVEILEESKKINQNRKYISRCIESAIDKLIKNNNIITLKKLINYIIAFLEKEESDNELNSIRQNISKGFIFLIKEGEIKL